MSTHTAPHIDDTREGLYLIHGEDGQLIAYAAKVQAEDDGKIGHGFGYWFAGSASGPITGHISALYVGKRFDHWSWGLCEVEKINRKTIRLAVLDAVSDTKTGERVLNV